MSTFLKRWAEAVEANLEPPKMIRRQPEPESEVSEPSEPQIEAACRVLNQTGCRIIWLPELEAVGVWSDKDSAAIRAALKTLRMDTLPLLYLDSERCPSEYKVRRMPGEPVSLSTLRQMEAAELNGEPGWKIRDRLREAQ